MYMIAGQYALIKDILQPFVHVLLTVKQIFIVKHLCLPDRFTVSIVVTVSSVIRNTDTHTMLVRIIGMNSTLRSLLRKISVFTKGFNTCNNCQTSFCAVGSVHQLLFC